jgi:head-tail adaptor
LEADAVTCKPCKDEPRLTDRVTIEKPDPAATAGAGGHVDLSDDDNWTTVASRYASVRTRGGLEARAAEQTQGVNLLMVEMRSDPVTRTIQPNWRLKLDTRVFNIEAAYDIDNAKQFVRCEVKEPR